MTGVIFDIKEMAVHDGPGIRTTVFFKGCPLRCMWCHNPEGLLFEAQFIYKKARCKGCQSCLVKCSHEDCQPFGRCIHRCPNNCLEIAGKEVLAQSLAEELRDSAKVLGDQFGGFTFSGGEPLAQSEFLLELIDNLHGYHLCIETSGYARRDVFERVIDKLDYVIMDIKLADATQHKLYTGVDNKVILENFNSLVNSGKPYLIRTPLIPDITDTRDNLARIREIIGECRWEQLPYNAAAGAKYEMLGWKYKL